MDSRHVADNRQQSPKTFDDLCRELKFRLRNVPPNSRISLEFVTNGNSEIHNYRISQTEDKGPLALTFN